VSLALDDRERTRFASASVATTVKLASTAAASKVRIIMFSPLRLRRSGRHQGSCTVRGEERTAPSGR
jgi:hypothetical protein